MTVGIKDNTLIEYMGNAENVEVPAGVKEIGESAFLGCTRLKTAEISETVEKIGKMAFFKCEGLKRINIPKNVSYIDDTAFWRCEKLEEIKVDVDNKSYCDIDGVLFSKDKKILILYPCGKDADTYVVPKDVEKIADRAFCFSRNLKKIVFKDGVKTIGDYAFEQCINLEDVKLPDFMDGIGEFVFDGCAKMKNIFVPRGIRRIATGAFGGCQNLENIIVDEENFYYKDTCGVLIDTKKKSLMCYPIGKKEKTYTVPVDVKSINKFAFCNNKSIEKVILFGIVKIESNAFFGCNKKLEITYK